MDGFAMTPPVFIQPTPLHTAMLVLAVLILLGIFIALVIAARNERKPNPPTKRHVIIDTPVRMELLNYFYQDPYQRLTYHLSTAFYMPDEDGPLNEYLHRLQDAQFRDRDYNYKRALLDKDHTIRHERVISTRSALIILIVQYCKNLLCYTLSPNQKLI